jgi:acetyl esterase/lipase
MLGTTTWVAAVGAAPPLYHAATFDVANATNLIYAQGLTCKDQLNNETCTPMDLKLDAYMPRRRGAAGVDVPALKPAYILAHGGGNSGGAKEQYCFQGSAAFFAARGFVAFNIDYRLKGDNGLLPPAPAPPPAKAGDKLVSHVARCSDEFYPHPQKAGAAAAAAASGGPHAGPLQLGTDGKPPPSSGSLCITVPPSAATAAAVGAAGAGAPAAAAADRQLTLEACATNASAPLWGAQQWRLPAWSVKAQPITHVESGLCLDLEGGDAAAAPTAGLAAVVAPCDAGSGVQAGWQLGYSGALITRNAAMSVGTADATGALRGGLLGWKPSWQSGYPAVRDLKAAVRWVKAHAAAYGIDPARVAVSGGSAGATNSVAAGATLASDYVDELSVADDRTLASTHLEQDSAVHCVVAHWSSGGEVALAQAHDPGNRSRFTTANAPIIEFHGSIDTTIPISQAYEVQAAYAATGVPYELHVLEGCAHSAWCYNGKGNCSSGCPDHGPPQGGRGAAAADGGGGLGDPNGYDPTMDTIALPFLATHLNLDLR